jgi:predicted  nucleic acid-binding Zn-ribbon protein
LLRRLNAVDQRKMSKCPECGATMFPRDEKDASLVEHLKDQHRVDHGSALAIRGLQREIDELKKRLDSLESIEK